jgi:hypothetical protein
MTGQSDGAVCYSLEVIYIYVDQMMLTRVIWSGFMVCMSCSDDISVRSENTVYQAAKRWWLHSPHSPGRKTDSKELKEKDLIHDEVKKPQIPGGSSPLSPPTEAEKHACALSLLKCLRFPSMSVDFLSDVVRMDKAGFACSAPAPTFSTNTRGLDRSSGLPGLPDSARASAAEVKVAAACRVVNASAITDSSATTTALTDSSATATALTGSSAATTQQQQLQSSIEDVCCSCHGACGCCPVYSQLDRMLNHALQQHAFSVSRKLQGLAAGYQMPRSVHIIIIIIIIITYDVHFFLFVAHALFRLNTSFFLFVAHTLSKTQHFFFFVCKSDQMIPRVVVPLSSMNGSCPTSLQWPRESTSFLLHFS